MPPSCHVQSFLVLGHDQEPLLQQASSDLLWPSHAPWQQLWEMELVAWTHPSSQGTSSWPHGYHQWRYTWTRTDVQEDLSKILWAPSCNTCPSWYPTVFGIPRNQVGFSQQRWPLMGVKGQPQNQWPLARAPEVASQG